MKTDTSYPPTHRTVSTAGQFPAPDRPSVTHMSQGRWVGKQPRYV